MKQTNYLTEKDPTLSQTRWAIIIMWVVTISIVIGTFVKIKPLLNPVSYELNGYMKDNNYVWGELK